MEEVTRVKPETVQFAELMLNIRNGKIRIPDFQREFVWDLSQIISLLDSIYHHYPIGSFLFWHTDDDIQSYRRVGEIELRHDDAKFVQFVLDGQQRLTSLFASLEQASIAHRVNGKKVTKSVQVYFDLDEGAFVANPFDLREAKAVAKRKTFSFIPGADDYLHFLDEFLRMIEEESPSKERVLEWLFAKTDIAISRARRIYGATRDMGLYNETDENCSISELGRALLESSSSAVVVSLLLDRIEHFDAMLPKILQAGSAEPSEMAEYLTKRSDEKVGIYKVSSRLKWLVGLRLGEFEGTRFALSADGRAVLEDVYREIEIRERDKKEQEEEKKKRYFSVRQISDINKFVETAAMLDDERREELNKVLGRFTSYPFSVIHVLEQPIETACEIFERINNSGKVLNVVDLMVAKSWSQTFNMRERLSDFREELQKRHFDGIPDITIIQCLAAIVKRGVRRKDILGIERGAVEKNWELALENIRRAIDFLTSNVKVTHAKILPYNACLVPLAFYFFATEPKAHDNARRKALERWFWRASTSSRYDQAAESKLADDIADMADLADGKEVAFNYLAPPLSVDRIVTQKLNLGSAFCKTILCVLNNRGPREFKTSEPVALTSFSKFNAAEFHHIFPQAYLKRHDKENYPDRDSMANIAFARASANKLYSSNAPSKYLGQCDNNILNDVLRSHFVCDKDKSGVLKDEFIKFVNYRAQEILQDLRRLTGEMPEIEAEMADSELKTLERFELRMRGMVDARLRAVDDQYWSKTSSPEFRDRIEGRISDWLKEEPGRSRNEAREVDFCQIFDYLKIVKSHWVVFEEVFRSRSDLEQYLKIIRNFRNALAHNREVDLPTRQLALGALAWFDKAFSAANIN